MVVLVSRNHNRKVRRVKERQHPICRGVRGATTVAADDATVIVAATQELLEALVRANDIHIKDVVSIIFSATSDLTTVFPAAAARVLGWHDVPMLCTRELEVTGALPRCIRVLLHWNTPCRLHQIHHVYLHEAVILRPDWLPSGPAL